MAKRRAVVRELSGGRCGYLHIPDMGGSGWAQFNRDLRLEVSRPALIVDVRGNAGGHISELVVEKLTRTHPRLGPHPQRPAGRRTPRNAPRGPVVALADEATSSDGDMITAAFKLLKLGPVVGQRTWGGVVGMTGRHRLGDGTVITVPMNAAWFDAYGWSVENHGVEPDIEVLRTPLDWAEGRYTQLARAVRTALDLLEEHPAGPRPTTGTSPAAPAPSSHLATDLHLLIRNAGYTPAWQGGKPPGEDTSDTSEGVTMGLADQLKSKAEQLSSQGPGKEGTVRRQAARRWRPGRPWKGSGVEGQGSAARPGLERQKPLSGPSRRKMAGPALFSPPTLLVARRPATAKTVQPREDGPAASKTARRCNTYNGRR